MTVREMSMRITPPQQQQPCPHLADFRSQCGPHPYRALHTSIRAGPMGRSSLIISSTTRCCFCSMRHRLYTCLSCAAVVCHVHGGSHHQNNSNAADVDDMQCRHVITVDADRAELFCTLCGDQVYDAEFDAAVLAAASGGPTTILSPPPPPENLRKRRRIDYRRWEPGPVERALIARNSTLLLGPEPPTKPGPEPDNTLQISGSGLGLGPSPPLLPWGLRGLNNMGSTCFMNSVLQALIHTPPLRNYFLSDRHNRFFCQRNNNTSNGILRRRNVNGNANGNSENVKKNLCLACDMDGLFSAVFSGGRTPYTPAKLLYSWWQHAANLATYEQQDAHEFFISMLDGIHEKLAKDRAKQQNQGSGDCCIAHRVFSGILRSDVMCMACGFTSTTYDPCVDISLDLETNKLVKGGPSKSRNSCNGEADPTRFGLNSRTSTLTGCLDRFTRPERLGPEQKFFCQQCKVRQESLKQMSVRKLPLVSCFHVKRFEHSSLQKTARKVDQYLQFPFSLNMAPYMSSSILRSRFGNRILSSKGEPQDAPDELSSEFELFAVITHTGKLNAGHYVTYLRLSNQWYKCDDAWITQVSESIVRAAQGYMMFYVQKRFHYKASETPTPS